MVNKEHPTALTGILFMLSAIFSFSIANLFVKSVAQHYPIIEIVFFRNLFALIPASMMVFMQGGLSTLKTPQLRYHMVCGTVGVIGLTCLFTSFQRLPLADATCFAYASILFVTALSGPFLKEYIDRIRWMAVILGFIGVIIMAKPTGNILNYGIFFSIGFSLTDAFIMLSARKLSQKDKPGTIVFYYVLFSIVISGALLVLNWKIPTWGALFNFSWNWKTPSWHALLQFAGVGCCGGVGQILVTQAYKRAPAGAIGPMIYSSMLWSVLFGYIFWDEIPALNLWIGSAVVITSGLIIVYRENKANALSKPPISQNRPLEQMSV